MQRLRTGSIGKVRLRTAKRAWLERTEYEKMWKETAAGRQMSAFLEDAKEASERENLSRGSVGRSSAGMTPEGQEEACQRAVEEAARRAEERQRAEEIACKKAVQAEEQRRLEAERAAMQAAQEKEAERERRRAEQAAKRTCDAAVAAIHELTRCLYIDMCYEMCMEMCRRVCSMCAYMCMKCVKTCA